MRSIAQFLGGGKTEKGYIVCGDNIVTCARGHLINLVGPDFYLPDTVPTNKNGNKVWRLDDLPIFPEHWRTTFADKECKSIVGLIDQLVKKVDVIVHAGDAEREGQLIVDEVLDLIKNTKPVKRLWLSELSQKGFDQAFKEMKDNKDYATLYASALARQRADWLLGMNATRFMTIKSGASSTVNVGRVQIPALRILADRELAIRNFKPKDYFELYAVSEQVKLKWQPAEKDGVGFDEEGRVIDRSVVEAIADKIKGSRLDLVSVTRSMRQESPPMTHDLTSLQKKMKGFSPKKTLDVCQKLYEKGFISYPRTECRYLPEVKFEESASKISMLIKSGYQLALNANPDIKSTAWNQAQVDKDAHSGLMPSEEKAAGLSADEQRVYDEIVNSFLIQFYPNAQWQDISIKAHSSNEAFSGKFSNLMQRGWRDAYGENANEDEDDSPVASNVPAHWQSGHSTQVEDTVIQAKKTTIPKRYNESEVPEVMQKAYLHVEDPRFRSILKDIGLGRPSSRADIVEKLKDQENIEVKSGKVYVTDRGIGIIGFMPDHLKDVGRTAVFEQELERIVQGKKSLSDFESNMRQYVTGIINLYKDTPIVISGVEIRKERPAYEMRTVTYNGKDLIITGESEKAYFVSVDEQKSLTCVLPKSKVNINENSEMILDEWFSKNLKDEQKGVLN